LHDTRSRLRDDFLSLANWFAEFCGWLNQDQRRYADAERWTSKALDFAQALDDAHLKSYTLMRRSNIATETGRGHDALLLAEAALHPQPLTPGLRALAFRQKAAALALLGDEAGYRQAVDDGLDAAGRHDAFPLTVYCTVPYMKMEAGAAAMNLRQPRLAAQFLADAWRDWPTGHDRDRALCLARLAGVHAEMGDPDQACDVGRQVCRRCAWPHPSALPPAFGHSEGRSSRTEPGLKSWSFASSLPRRCHDRSLLDDDCHLT